MRIATCKCTKSFLEFILTARRVWAEVIEQLGKLRSVFSEASPEIKANLKKFTLQLVSPAAEKIGWEFAKNEDFLTGRLRALLITAAGSAGHEGYFVLSKSFTITLLTQAL